MDNYKIYCYTNNINGMKYIGQTKNTLEKRAGFQGNNYKPKNGKEPHPKSFWQAIIDYGWSIFSSSILEENISSVEEADKKEQYWIEYYHTWIKDPQCKGYNLTKGGNHTDLSERSKTRWLNIDYQNIKSKQSSDLWQDEEYVEKTKQGSKKYWSDKKNREKQSERAKNRGKHPFKTKCRCIETGIIYDSMAEAARENGISNGTIISAICRGKKKSIHELHWEYV